MKKLSDYDTDLMLTVLPVHYVGVKLLALDRRNKVLCEW